MKFSTPFLNPAKEVSAMLSSNCDANQIAGGFSEAFVCRRGQRGQEMAGA
jgi:hypothetical protein